MANQIVISRIQNRRGIKENLPQPLLPGEFALTIDTGELWIGTDPSQPPWGIRTYGSGLGDITAGETIVDYQIVSAKFTTGFLTPVTFQSLEDALTASLTLTLTELDILWDEVDTIFIAADTSVDADNTVVNIIAAIDVWDIGGERDAVAYNTLGAINDPAIDPATTFAFDQVDGDFLFTIGGSNAKQGSNAASLINQIHGAQLVTTLANLQVTTSGIGVGSSTFRDHTVLDTDDGTFTWQDEGTASADSTTDELTWVSGEGISLEVDTVLDAIRITNTIDSVSAAVHTLTASTASFTDVPNLSFDMEAPGLNISDVVILEYSINIGGATPGVNNYTAIGSMMIVGNILVGAGTASLSDNQVEVRDAGLVGDVDFEALFSAGTGTGGADEIIIQYTNTFTTNVSMKVLKRRWSSF
jgi:hypothetical protein